MSYSGEVEVGGPADTREAGDLVITKVAVGPMANNAYLLRCALTGEQALIDAADEPDTLLALVGDAGLARVITTHSHPDHWQALADVVGGTGAETVASPVDAEDIPVPTTNPVTDGARVRVGSCELEVITLVGHTPARSPSPTTTPTASSTCSPATRCSPAASATPAGPRRTSPR